MRQRRRLAVVLVVLVVAVTAYVVALDRPTEIPTYRIVDQLHLVLRAQTGAAVLVSLARQEETAESVVVVVNAVGLPLPSGGTNLTDVPVVLTQPLGQRAVVDGSTGAPVTLLQELTP